MDNERRIDMAFKIADGKPINTQLMLVGTGGVTADGLVVVSSGKAVKAAQPISAATLVGIARETVASGSYVQVDLIENHLIEATFTGSSKSSLADTDLATVFDVTGDLNINLDDTTGGTFVVGGNGIAATAGTWYDNTNLLVRGKFTAASRYI